MTMLRLPEIFVLPHFSRMVKKRRKVVFKKILFAIISMINLIILDDQEIFRAGLHSVFQRTADIRVIEQTGNADAALKASESGRADLLIFEPFSTGHTGIDFILQAKRRVTNLPILVITANRGVDFARRTLQAGASGFLGKHTSGGQLVEVVRKIASGQTHICDLIADKLISEGDDRIVRVAHAKLSAREMEVFLRIANGENCTEIAQKLSLSSKTISTHKAKIFDKLRFSSVADLVLYAAAHELIDT